MSPSVSSFLSLALLVDVLFGVTVKASFAALALGAVLYVFAATASAWWSRPSSRPRSPRS